MGDQSDGDKRAGVEDKNLLQYDCLHSNMSHGQTKKSEVYVVWSSSQWLRDREYFVCWS